MPTYRQKKAMEIRNQKIIEGKPIKMGEILLEAGYSREVSLKPALITKSQGWQELLEKYDDEPVMDAVYKDALNKEDKRNATENRRLYFQLKDRFPAGKLKIEQYNEELSAIVLKDDRQKSVTSENRLPSQTEPAEDSGLSSQG